MGNAGSCHATRSTSHMSTNRGPGRQRKRGRNETIVLPVGRSCHMYSKCMVVVQVKAGWARCGNQTNCCWHGLVGCRQCRRRHHAAKAGIGSGGAVANAGRGWWAGGRGGCGPVWCFVWHVKYGWYVQRNAARRRREWSRGGVPEMPVARWCLTSATAGPVCRSSAWVRNNRPVPEPCPTRTAKGFHKSGPKML